MQIWSGGTVRYICSKCREMVNDACRHIYRQNIAINTVDPEKALEILYPRIK